MKEKLNKKDKKRMSRQHKVPIEVDGEEKFILMDDELESLIKEIVKEILSDF